MKIRSTLSLALVACLPAAPSLAQTAAPATSTSSPAAAPAAAPPADTSPSLLDSLKLPDLRKLNLPLPRSVQAANALLGMATQRLALVVGTGNVGPQILLPSVSRDTQAVAAALRAAGFVVMVREDLNAEDLRAALDEFRGRLQPGGTGFLYFAGLGTQVGGENVVLTRGLQVTGTGANTRIKGTAVPLQEVVEAVQGTPESPRYLVVDAAYSHPTLATISSQGLAAQKVPPGVMALFSQSPGVAAEAPEPFPLPLPTPTDPRLTAGSTFGRELVRSLVTPKLNGSDILRVTRGAMLDVTAGKQAPLIVGESASQDEFAEPNLLDTLFPRTPEDLAREGLKQALRAGSNAGEIPVSQVGNAAAPVSSAPATTTAPAPTATTPGESLAADNTQSGPNTQRNALDSATRRLADGPSPTSLLSTAAGATAAVGSAVAGAAGTAAVVGTVAATAQAGAMATAMGVATSVASSAVGVLGSVAALVSGGSSSSGGAAAAVAANEASKLVRPASALGALSQAGNGNARNQAAAAAPSVAGSVASGGATAAPSTTPTTAPAATTGATPAAAPAVQVAQAVQSAQALPSAQAAPATAGGPAAPGPATQTPPATAAAPGAAEAGTALAQAGPAAPVNAAANAQRQAQAMAAGNSEAVGAAQAAGPGVAGAPGAAQELPVSAVNAAVPAAAPAALAGAGGFAPPTPRTAVPDGMTADQLPAAGQQLPGQPRTAKQQNGGERPAYVPKVNPFGYAEGDTFMYRTMDTWKDQHLGNSVQTVEEVLPNGDLLTDGHQTLLDAQGRFKRQRQLDGTVSQYEPAQELWWSNPARGQKRDVLFKESFQRADQSRGQIEWKGSASVGRLTKVSTQAGEFEAFPIESSGWYYEKLGRSGPLNSGQWSRTVWYSPKLGHPVAIDIEEANAMGKLLKRERVELLQVQSAKSLATSAP